MAHNQEATGSNPVCATNPYLERGYPVAYGASVLAAEMCVPLAQRIVGLPMNNKERAMPCKRYASLIQKRAAGLRATQVSSSPEYPVRPVHRR